MLDERAHRLFVQRPVCLGPGRAYGRALTRVEHAKVNARQVRGLTHDAIERIDFSHQVALADAADGRVTRHLADGFDALGQQQGTGAHSSRC